MLSESIKKVKSWITENTSDVYVAVLIFLVSVASFGLGRLSILWPAKQPIQIIEKDELLTTKNTAAAASSLTANSSLIIHNSALGKYVASKSGKSYHFPWCPGATNINEQNKTWFQTKEAAEQAGYKPAANCPGL